MSAWTLAYRAVIDPSFGTFVVTGSPLSAHNFMHLYISLQSATRLVLTPLEGVARSSVSLRRAFDAMDRKRRGFVEPDDLLRYVQRERGIPAACLSHCRTALQRHMGSQRIGYALVSKHQAQTASSIPRFTLSLRRSQPQFCCVVGRSKANPLFNSTKHD